jgi:hypothetical protein
LNEPVRCRFSALRWISPPQLALRLREENTGVVRTISADACRRSWSSATVAGIGPRDRVVPLIG